jgi:hypothetical protein
MNPIFPLYVDKRRILLIMSVILYVLVFNWSYKLLIAPAYGYFGLSYNSPALGYLLVSWMVSLIPALWMPIEFKRPSLLLFYIQYFVLFIPAAFVLYHTSKPTLSPEEVLCLVLLMFVGLSIIQSIYLLPILRLQRVVIRYFWVVFVLSMAALLGCVLLKFGSNFRLANLEEIYEVRSAMSEMASASGSRFDLYAQPWLAGFFLPFFFAVGVFSKRWWIIALVAMGYLTLFGIGGSKTTLFSMVYISFVYLWLTRSSKFVTSSFVLGLSTILVLPVFLEFIFPPIISKWYVAVLHFRTFSIPSLLIAQYYEFFQDNPLTYMSHVSGVNLLVHYPYDKAYSLLIGEYFYGGGGMNSNAGVWAGDGLAGFGPQGIVIMSAVCAIVFYLMDCLSRSYDARFVAVAITFAATSFMNAPLSTTLLTGGLGFLMLALIFLPNKGLLKVAFSESKDPGDYVRHWRISPFK